MNDRLNELASTTSSERDGSRRGHELDGGKKKSLRRRATGVFKSSKRSRTTTGKSGGAAESLNGIIRDVTLIKECIGAVRKATERIGAINENALRTTSNKQQARLSEEVSSLVTKTNGQARTIKILLERIDRKNAKLKKGGKINDSELRMRTNLYGSVGTQFMEEMALYRSAQEQYRDNLKGRATRQVLAVRPNATEEEIHEALEGDNAEQLLRSAFLSGGGADPIRIQYSSVESKYREIKELERSVSELNGMFRDLAYLTCVQGEVIDHIEINVNKAGEYIDEGNEHLYESIKTQKKIRKKNCLIIVTVVIIVVIVVVIPLL